MTIMSQDVADSHMQLRQYLCRIQFLSQDNWHQAELPAPTLETLITIHRLHVDNIPFENLLFVHHLLKGTHRPVDLTSLHKRIVLRKRGGMCQEQNALLLHNLRALGEGLGSGAGALVG
jgi:N-hydroxyarylamine O-acetyltransferase